MLTPSLTWQRQTELAWLKSTGTQVDGLTGSIAVLEQVADDVIPGGMGAGVQRAAEMMQSYAQANARWQDRTGVARKNLRGYAQVDGDNYTAGIYGDTTAAPHLLWLHLSFGGRYAIIDQTQQAFAPRMGEIITGEVTLALTGHGSQFRSVASGRFI